MRLMRFAYLIPYNLRDSAIYGNLPIQYVT